MHNIAEPSEDFTLSVCETFEEPTPSFCEIPEEINAPNITPNILEKNLTISIILINVNHPKINPKGQIQ